MLAQFKRMSLTCVGKALSFLVGEWIPDFPKSLEAPAKWISPYRRGRILLGLYEKQEQSLVRKYLAPDLDTVELGCGIGVVSSSICRRLNTGIGFVGVEANDELLEIANANIHRFESNVPREIKHGAIVGTADEAERKFYVARNNFHSSSVNGSGDVAREIRVPAFTLSSLLEACGFSEYQLVADVEGVEVDMIRCDAAAFANCKRAIIELHEVDDAEKTIKTTDLVAMLEDLGFEKVDQDRDVFVFERRQDEDDNATSFL